MKVLLYLMFIIIYGFLLFKLPAIYPKKKVLLISGLGIFIAFLILILGYFVFLLIASKNSNLLIYEKQVINIFMGIISLFFFSFFVHLFVETILENILIKFHQVNNSENLESNPIKFVIDNVQKIKMVIKTIFFLGGFLVYYGICFGAPK